MVLRRSSSAPDTAHPNHRLHATIKKVDGEFQSLGAIAVAETTAADGGEDL
jgi:hypothetical protein